MEWGSLPRSTFASGTVSGEMETSECSAQLATSAVASSTTNRRAVMETSIVRRGCIQPVSGLLLLLHQNPQLANLVGQRLPGDLEQLRGAVLVAARLEQRFLDQLAAEAEDGVLVRADRHAGAD